MSKPETLDALLGSFEPDRASPHAVSVQKALRLARYLQERARALQTPAERRQQAELDRMLHTSTDKSTLVQMTDEAFRAREPHRAVDHLIHILDVQGVPRFFSPLDRTLLKGFQSFGGYASRLWAGSGSRARMPTSPRRSSTTPRPSSRPAYS